MIKIDNNLLVELGLGELPAAEKNRILAQIYETLELRVGVTLASQMTDEQLTEFESFIDSGNEAGALKWLEANFPNYKQVVAAELEKLKGEIKKDALKIMAAVQESTSAAPQGPNQPIIDATQTQPPADQNLAQPPVDDQPV